jgi:signal transduction histidine kinase
VRSYDRGVLPLPRTPLTRDAVVAVGVAAVAQLELLLSADRVSGTLVWHQLSYLLIVPALLLRRRAPLAATMVAAAGLALDPLVGPAPVATPYLVLLVLLASLGWHASLRRGLVGVSVTLACGMLYDVTTDDFLLADLVVNVVIIVATWAAGRGLRVATDRRVAAELETDRREREAATAERTRIARDLHDSLAHALTLITLQAGGARERTAEPVAHEALSAIERSGREALADMHRFLGLLGRGEGEAPGVAHLPELVDGVAGHGLTVDLDVHPGEVPASVSTTVYRVVQEALTNAVRHSEATSARVSVQRCQGDLVTVVSTYGPRRPAPTGGGGRGIAGLRERLALFDGTLESGATDAGWRTEARIPVAGAGT